MPKTLERPSAAPVKKSSKGPGRKPGSRNRKFGLPVREAKMPLSMPLLQVDIEKACEVKKNGNLTVNDPENFLSCVIAQAATRAWGAERVAILRETAYVAFPGEKHTKRYLIDRKSRRVLEAWDRGEPVVEGVELRLIPPSPKRTRAAFSRRHKAHAEANKGKSRPLTDRKQRKPDPLHNIVRNGNLVRWS